MNFGLTQKDIENIKTTLAGFDEIESAIIFGSRAKGNSKNASDVDIAIKGNAVSHDTIVRLYSMLDDTYLPYFFDVVDYQTIDNQALKEHIDRVGKNIYHKN